MQIYRAKRKSVFYTVLILILMLTIGYLKLASTLIPVLHSPLTFDPLASSSSLPSCWGNPADVGACDYDYQWKPVPQNLYQKGIKKDGRWTRLPGRRHDKLRVLYLKYREDYLSRAYRYFYDEIEVASTHPSLDVRLWGPGFYGYDESKSLDVNIKENFGSNDFFQVVYTSAYGFQNFNLTQSAFVYSLGDCHDFVCRREIFPNHDVLAFRYAFEPMDLFRYEQVEQLKKERSVDFVDRENWFPLMYHSNECSLDRYFYPATPLYDNETWADSRPVDVRQFGQARYPFYPLRYKVVQGMKKGTIRGSPMELSKWWQEPGEKETSPKAPKNPEDLGKFIVDDPLTFHLQHTPKEWAAGMRETKICVFDSSAERKTIRKFNEAFLSGCVVASDIPHEMEHVFRGVVIELSDSMSESEIDKILGDALADPERLAEMALEAHKRARVYFNCRNKVDKLLQVASKYMDGEKGYWFPDGYSAVCRSYSTDPKKKFAPAWYKLMIPIISTDGCSLDSLLIPSHYQQDLQRILIPHGLIKDRVAKLAHDIAKDTRNPLVACCVLKGAFGFYADLISCLKKNKNAEGLNIPMSFEFLKVKSYVNDQSTGSVEISLSEQDLSTFKGKDILIVEDIIDTGHTMVALLQKLKTYEPASIKVVSLLVKKTPRSNSYVPDYAGFSIPDLFVVGYCLDYNEHFRDLDHICEISKVGMEKYRE